MSFTALSAIDAGLSRRERLDDLGQVGRREHYDRGELSLADLSLWAALYPEEAPLVNGEYEWIVSRLPG